MTSHTDRFNTTHTRVDRALAAVCILVGIVLAVTFTAVWLTQNVELPEAPPCVQAGNCTYDGGEF